MHRRKLLRSTGVGVASAFLAGCTGGGNESESTTTTTASDGGDSGGGQETTAQSEEPASIHTITPEGASYVAAFLYAKEQGLWKDEYNIDLSMEVASFGKYKRAISAGLADVAGEQPTQVRLINEGEDLVFLGSELNMFTRMFAKAGDDTIEDPTDLSDKVLGLPFGDSMTTLGFKALIKEEYGFDIMEDTKKTVTAAPPVLWNRLVKAGEIDAMGQFSGYTVKGVANSDAVKTIFDPYELWIDRTGRPAPITIQTATRSWLESNPGVALRYVRAWHDTLDLFKENAEEAIGNYGRLGGITTEKEARALRNLMQDDVIYGPVLDQKQIDANWEFIQLLSEHDVFETLPQKGEIFFSRAELEDLASG